MGRLVTDENVFLFPRVKDDSETIVPPGEIVRPAHDACRHRRQVVLDKAAHQMKCADCGQILDCFDWIHEYVSRWDSENTYYRQARQQRADAVARLAELTKAEKNQKARLRKRGVTLTTAEARALKDVLATLEHIAMSATSEDHFTRARMTPAEIKRQIAQIDRDAYSAARRALREMLDLKEVG